jgi:hypothetical protein
MVRAKDRHCSFCVTVMDFSELDLFQVCERGDTGRQPVARDGRDQSVTTDRMPGVDIL